ncbi:biotin-dependent carboxyltransferase family protein [Amycolatopsis sp. NPDC102389]|uniref:5-oxoprolinase subunit C family protein n=1 Tax=Amycolatopsis sp. NPDC102389 TaxID=3363941 RepID=UPI00381FA563
MTKPMSGKTIPVLEVIEPGLQTTVQDYPGRVGMQSMGFFPAGPVDPLAFQTANLLVGNRAGTAGLEIPQGRFQASFLHDCTIAITGPDADATLNGEPIPGWEAVPVAAGDLLACGIIAGPGYRRYLAISGGIAVPEVFGSRSTFLVAGLGGLDGRALEQADVLETVETREPRVLRRVPTSLRPSYTDHWEIEVLRGPHADPDFFSEEGYRDFLDAVWRCDLSSDRVGVRFNPRRLRWARASGDIAGGHPSNLLDSSYPLGGILAYGDVLTILCPEANTSGGFAVVATVAHASFWKVGQLRPGRDSVTFREVDLAQAAGLDDRLEHALDARNFDRL